MQRLQQLEIDEEQRIHQLEKGEIVQKLRIQQPKMNEVLEMQRIQQLEMDEERRIHQLQLEMDEERRIHQLEKEEMLEKQKIQKDE
jgi:hypothetical protein